MSASEYYQSWINQPVEIQCSDGSVLIGIVNSVDQDNIYLMPLAQNEMQRESRDPGFFFGPGFGQQAFWGGFAGSLLGVGLSTIIGVRPYPAGPGPFVPYGPRPPYGPFYGPGPFY